MLSLLSGGEASTHKRKKSGVRERVAEPAPGHEVFARVRELIRTIAASVPTVATPVNP